MVSPIRVAALTVAGVLVGFNVPATAHATDTASNLPPSQVAGLDPGEQVTVTGAELLDARQDAGSVALLEDEAAAQITEELVEAASEQGSFADADFVDVIPVLDGAALLAVPDDVLVESVVLARGTEGDLSASVQTAGAETQSLELSGPQMAANWAPNGSGDYKLYLYVDPPLGGRTLLADGFFSWQRQRFDADGRTYYSYRRFGDAQPAALNNERDAQIKTLRIQSFPFDAVEPNLLGWERYSPGADRDDDCTAYEASLSFKGVGVSVPFAERCGKYNMWRNLDKPSSYWLQYEGPGGGNRQVGYALVWSQRRGTAGSMHDLNQIKISFPFPSGRPDQTCTQTDASRTCGG